MVGNSKISGGWVMYVEFLPIWKAWMQEMHVMLMLRTQPDEQLNYCGFNTTSVFSGNKTPDEENMASVILPVFVTLQHARADEWSISTTFPDMAQWE
jgi:hypothetical protein